jgi:hypothetical protein
MSLSLAAYLAFCAAWVALLVYLFRDGISLEDVPTERNPGDW